MRSHEKASVALVLGNDRGLIVLCHCHGKIHWYSFLSPCYTQIRAESTNLTSVSESD